MPLPTPTPGAAIIWDSVSGGAITSNGYTGTTNFGLLQAATVQEPMGVYTSNIGSTPICTFTPPATAGTYRISSAVTVASATSAIVGWTATYTDAFGHAQTPTNLSMVNQGVAAPALTFTTTATSAATVAHYYGDAIIDINTAAANIVVKLTKTTGTLSACVVSATIESI